MKNNFYTQNNYDKEVFEVRETMMIESYVWNNFEI